MPNPETPNNSESNEYTNDWKETMSDMPEQIKPDTTVGEKVDNIEITTLTREDLENHPDQIGEALYLVDQYIFPDLFGDENRAKVLAKELFSDDDPNAFFSLEKTRVAKDSDGNIIGILVFRDQNCSPWNTEKIREKFEKSGFGTTENFERANENYMKKITDAELPDGAVEIEFVGIRTEYQGRGIGTKLMRAVMDDPKYTEAHLDVLDSHPGARKLYDKLGFQPDGEKFPNYPDGSEGVQHMVCKKEEN